MNERWRKLIHYGIVRRAVFGDRPPIEVEYSLTPFGQRFAAILDEVRQLQSAVDRGDADLADETQTPLSVPADAGAPARLPDPSA